MGDAVKRVLFVNSEMAPYLPETEMSILCRNLPQGIQERKREIRSFMPRYGCINERKNQLHEVIRLSGMNLIINEVDRPLIIKVASIAAARIQVYFIDNEDFFKRKQLMYEENGKFFEDNGERAIFFAKGVLETVKKLRWAPDIIHCSGWISHVLPIYLKKVYNDDPIFANSKVVLSLYGDTPTESFSANFKDELKAGDIADSEISILSRPTGINLAKIAARFADGVIYGSADVNQEVKGYCKCLHIPILPFDKEAVESGKYIDDYNNFYDQL